MKKLVSLLMVVILIVALSGCSSTTGGPAEEAKEPAEKSSKYPSKAIEIVVPYAAGGGVDMNTRAIQPFLEKELDTTVVVMNKPGGGGVLGVTYAIMSEPDGNRLLLTNLIAMCSASALNTLQVDLLEGVEYIGGTVVDPGVIAVSKNSKFNSLDEIIEELKKNPGSLSFGVTGETSLDNLICKNLEVITGAKFNTVSFDGGSEAMAALLGGHIDIMGGTLSEMLTYHKSGEVKSLAVGHGERIDSISDVPTFDELGYKMAVTAAKRAIMMPAGADEEIVKVLQDAVKAAASSEEFAKECESLGLMASYFTPEECVKTVTEVSEFLNGLYGKK
ncbi:MAG TPA: tripartite tricarboxylate transporter substrate binding protein [Bacillota bacterium]|nr:tripartite tricarboxylate transporter substrate binding protein [Bacillota bacterium]HQQ44851.1 tripartite tricarboxylate transporter substrate binding protein [Bacillota bacterium]